MQHLVSFLRLTAATLVALCLSSSATAEPPLIISGMDAVAGHSGWYTSNVTIHTARFVETDNSMTPAADILVKREGLNEIPVPDGMGGTALQLVNIDKTAPVVSITGFYLRDDGTAILSVAVSDPVSGPAALDVSLDNGLTWQTYTAQVGYPAPEYIWNVQIDQSQITARPTSIFARAVDNAGNMSIPKSFVGAEK